MEQRRGQQHDEDDLQQPFHSTHPDAVFGRK
jgi:hypothetical protein